jgi:hypothetical protein
MTRHMPGLCTRTAVPTPLNPFFSFFLSSFLPYTVTASIQALCLTIQPNNKLDVNWHLVLWYVMLWQDWTRPVSLHGARQKQSAGIILWDTYPAISRRLILCGSCFFILVKHHAWSNLVNKLNCYWTKTIILIGKSRGHSLWFWSYLNTPFYGPAGIKI